MIKLLTKLCLLFSLTLILSCDSNNIFDVDISSIPFEKVKIKRYEQIMFSIPPENFIQQTIEIAPKYPVFLGGDLTDTNAILSLKSFFIDPNMKELNSMVNNEFNDISDIEADLAKSFQYLKYYFPNLPNPEVYSYVSGLDFKYPVKFIEGSLLIALDMYLGSKTKAYEVSGFPQYRNHWSIRESILPDAMNEIAAGLLTPTSISADLLEQMIYNGKKLYFIHAMIPNLPDTLLFKYTQNQVDWVTKNQGNIWAYIVENQILYTTDKRIIRKFNDDGPFTDLFSKSSPSRLSYFIGYQIVKAFMEESDYSLQKLLLENEPQKILKVSHYKPKL